MKVKETGNCRKGLGRNKVEARIVEWPGKEGSEFGDERLGGVCMSLQMSGRRVPPHVTYGFKLR